MSKSAPPPQNFPRVIPLLVNWIDSRSYDDYQELIRQAWQNFSISRNELQNRVFSRA
ncbi:MAG: hypothetical protein QNJ17_05270 [Desulfocapsaceae bacterium]|nr:hypothetical protein [Desulfocapsaceae bacterium]